MGVPEISVRDLAARLKTQDDFILLDVREQWEIDLAHLTDARLIILPMSVLARQLINALPDGMKINREAEVLVLCHHGNRSASATGWLIKQGWKNVRSVAGGIDAYAREVDKTVGMY
jgi:rhodanese-related sulfurtransferase